MITTPSFSFDNVNTLRKKFYRDYLSFYAPYFEIVSPLPLRIYFDPTLSFTTCSICICKKMYFEGRKLKKYCVIQPAFRTNTYKEIHSQRDLKYTASLTVCGTFLPTDNLHFRDDWERAVLLQAKFLHNWLKHDQTIRLTVHEQLDIFSCKCIKALQSLGIGIISCNDGLLWDYGIDSFHGIGSRWEILSNGDCYNWGNVIAIYQGQEIVGIESGGSVEVALQGVLDLPHKILVNRYCNMEFASEIARCGSMAIKYFDVLDVIATILWETREEAVLSFQISAVLEQYIRAFKCLLVLRGIDRCSYELHIKLYEHSHAGWKQYPGLLLERFHKLISSQWNLRILTNDLAKKERHHWRSFSFLEQQAILFAVAHPKLLWFEG